MVKKQAVAIVQKNSRGRPRIGEPRQANGKNSAYMREYQAMRREDPEQRQKINEYQREYRAKNRAKVNEYQHYAYVRKCIRRDVADLFYADHKAYII